MRMSAGSACIEDGRVFLPQKAPWLDDFRSEVLAFPNGAHDDQVDALSQLINWSRKRKALVVSDAVLQRARLKLPAGRDTASDIHLVHWRTRSC